VWNERALPGVGSTESRGEKITRKKNRRENTLLKKRKTSPLFGGPPEAAKRNGDIS